MPEAPDLSHIAPALQQYATPVGELTPFPGNPRRGNINVIIDSLVTFGQQQPIIVQASTGFVVAGNHMLQAARALEWSHVAAVRSDLSEEEARAYLLADNRLSDLAVYDRDALTAVLRELDASDALTGTGYTREEINALMLDDAASNGEVAGNFTAPREPGDDGVDSWDGPALKQIVLLMPIAKGDEFLRSVAALRGVYGTSSNVSTILRAVERQANLAAR